MTACAVLAGILRAFQGSEPAERSENIVKELRRSSLATQFEKALSYRLGLVEARLEAIGFIADPQLYSKTEGHDEVNRRVQRVRHVWESYPGTLPKLNGECLRKFAELRALGAVPRDPFFATMERLEKEPVRSKDVALEFEDREVAPYNRSVDEFNQGIRASVSAEQWALIERLNAYREMMGRRKLKLSPELCGAAAAHSIDMKTRGYFAHRSPDGVDPPARAAARRFAAPTIGENIVMATDLASPDKAHEAWFRSAPHHRNMLSEQWTHVGVGSSGKPAGDAATYWTQMFGAKP